MNLTKATLHQLWVATLMINRLLQSGVRLAQFQQILNTLPPCQISITIYMFPWTNSCFASLDVDRAWPLQATESTLQAKIKPTWFFSRMRSEGFLFNSGDPSFPPLALNQVSTHTPNWSSYLASYQLSSHQQISLEKGIVNTCHPLPHQLHKWKLPWRFGIQLTTLRSCGKLWCRR